MFEIFCKVCLNTEAEFRAISDLRIQQMLIECTSIPINDNAQLNQFMCQNCVRDLIHFTHFKEKCVQIDTLFHECVTASIDGKVYLQKNNNTNVFIYSKDGENSEELVGVTFSLEEVPLDLLDEKENVIEVSVTEVDGTDPESVIDVRDTPLQELKVDYEEIEEPLPKKPKPTKKVTSLMDLKRFRCHKCETRFFSIHGLNKHFFNAHQLDAEGAWNFNCDACGLKFEEEQLFHAHCVQTHEVLFTCRACCGDFFKEDHYVKHLGKCVARETANLKKNTCTICSSVVTNLHRHMTFTHSSNNHANGRFQCKRCEKKFLTGKLYARHLSREHKVFTNYHVKCPQCSSQVLKSYLNHHMRIRHTNHQTLLTCRYCQRRDFKWLGYLREHQRQEHAQERASQLKVVQCELCSKRLKSRAVLLKHYDSAHSNARPWTCHLCNKTYKQSGHLTAHLRSHTKEKAYVCDVCGKAFAQFTAFKKHASVHGDSFACAECDKTIENSYSYRVHLKNEHSNPQKQQIDSMENLIISSQNEA